MSIPIGVTKKDYNKIKKVLQKASEVVCLTKDVHILYTLVAMDLLTNGEEVEAKIIKGY